MEPFVFFLLRVLTTKHCVNAIFGCIVVRWQLNGSERHANQDCRFHATKTKKKRKKSKQKKKRKTENKMLLSSVNYDDENYMVRF